MRFDLDSLLEPCSADAIAATRAFYADRPARRGPSGPEELAAVRAAAATPGGSGPPTVETIEFDGRSVPVRIHEPVSGAARGVLLDIHGGGFYLGPTACDDARARRTADALGLAVVSVDHRLAPEHPWPAATDDCETAARWLTEHAETRFGTGTLAISGFSAGATLTVATLVRLRNRGVDRFRAAVLQFGTYDLSGLTPAGRLIADEYFLDAYAGTAPDRTDADLSPIYADLRGLPPVLMVVGEHDVLVTDNLSMAGRLAVAGVDVDLCVYPAAPHGFTGHDTPVARIALGRIDSWLGARFDDLC